jgi:hypothetical protein
MMAGPQNNLPAAAHDGAARGLLAIEIGKQSWVIAAMTPLSRYTLESRTLKGLLELVDSFDSRSAARRVIRSR